MIKTSYDPEADAMFIWLAPEGAASASTREVEPGVILDFGDDGRLIGIELLAVAARLVTRPGAGQAQQPAVRLGT